MIRKTSSALSSSGNALSHLFLLLIRIFWGVLLIMAGLSKWVALSQTGAFFESIGIPFPSFMAWLVGLIEFLGGISLVLGLLTRLFGLLLSILFIVAYATAHSEVVIQFFVNPHLFLEQRPFSYLYTSLVVFCFGPGGISLDRLFKIRS